MNVYYFYLARLKIIFHTVLKAFSLWLQGCYDEAISHKVSRVANSFTGTKTAEGSSENSHCACPWKRVNHLKMTTLNKNHGTYMWRKASQNKARKHKSFSSESGIIEDEEARSGGENPNPNQTFPLLPTILPLTCYNRQLLRKKKITCWLFLFPMLL